MKSLFVSLFSGVYAAVAIAVLAYTSEILPHLSVLMAPFGASAVLIFALPNSPLARARNVIFGHLITAFVGLLFVQYFGASIFSYAIATGLAISLMQISDTIHPPAGANPILIIMTAQSWDFLLTPVFFGAIMLSALGAIAIRLRTILL